MKITSSLVSTFKMNICRKIQKLWWKKEQRQLQFFENMFNILLNTKENTWVKKLFFLLSVNSRQQAYQKFQNFPQNITFIFVYEKITIVEK